MKVEKVVCDVCKVEQAVEDPVLKVTVHLRKPDLSLHTSPKADMDVCVKCGERLAGALRLDPNTLK